jgi:4-hydroxybenzoate polyprenyltransferase
MEEPGPSNPGIWYGHILAEVDITRRLLASNATFVFGLYLLGLAPRMMTGSANIDRPGVLIAKVLFAALTTEYIFEICNQTLSPEEDARNRPSRPIPAGLLSIRGGYIRWIAVWTFSPAAFLAIGAPTVALHLTATMAWTFFCYVHPAPPHWFWKNLYTPVALFFLLRILNSLVVQHIPSSEMSAHLDSAFCLWLFATIHMQDFHDVEGDRVAGRRTLPIVLSTLQIGHLRRFTAALTVIAAMLFVGLGVQRCEGSFDLSIGVLASLQFVGGCATAGRFLLDETAKQGETTYKRFHVPTALVIVVYLSLVNHAASLISRVCEASLVI